MSKETIKGKADPAGMYGLYAAMVLSALLRLYKLGSQSIWGDESLTVLRYADGATLAETWSKIWHLAAHPPLYFILVHSWFKLGTSEFMLRFPSLVFGVASIPVMYALANRLFGRTAAIISAFVFALAPMHVWYSQEARMYSLQILLNLLATLYFVKVWQEGKARDGLGYAALVVLGLFAHLGTVFLMAAHGLFAIFASVRQWKRLAAWVGVQILIVLVFSPWLLNLVQAREASGGPLRIGDPRPSSVMDIGYGYFTFSIGYSLGPSIAELHESANMQTVMRYWPPAALSALAFGVLIVMGLRLAKRTNPWGFQLLLFLLLVPTMLAALISLLPGIPLNPRYMMVAVIPYWITLALGVQAAWRGRLTKAVPVLAAGLIAVSLCNHYFTPKYAKQDVRSAVHALNRMAQPGDAIVISSVELGGPFEYYFKRKDIPYYGYPPGVGHVDPEQLPTDMKKMLAGKERVWLILGRTWSSDPKGLIRRHFEANATGIERRHYSGVEVLCYGLSKSAGPSPSKPIVD